MGQLVSGSGEGQDRSVLTLCIREQDGHPIKGRGLPEDGPVPGGCDLGRRHFGAWPVRYGFCTVGSSETKGLTAPSH